jgi:hypothetical protein
MANTIEKNLNKDPKSDAKNNKQGKDIPGLTEDLLSQLIMTGDNESGIFSPEEKEIKEELEPNEELHEPQNKEAKIDKIKSVETKDEYKKAMIKDLDKHPDKYSIETPRGRMSVAEAIKQGFNPETGEFEKSLEEKNEEALSALNDNDRARVEEFIDPAQVGLSPADADAFGIPNASPMRKPSAPHIQPSAQIQPAQGAVTGSPSPIPQAQTPQGTNILSMLGGNM